LSINPITISGKTDDDVNPQLSISPITISVKTDEDVHALLIMSDIPDSNPAPEEESDQANSAEHEPSPADSLPTIPPIPTRQDPPSKKPPTSSPPPAA
jgi:hypothetical protein